MNGPAPLLELAERQPMAEASLAAWDRIVLTLSEREVEVFLLVCAYLEATGRKDVTGGELADWSGKLITSIRPRLTGLRKKHWLDSFAMRPSRAKYESDCHPYRNAVPKEAVERAKRKLKAAS